MQINLKKLRTEKVIKRKRNKLYVKWKGHDNSFNGWIDKKTLRNKHIKMNQYFPKPGDNNGEVDLSNYVKKSWFKKCNRNWYF